MIQTLEKQNQNWGRLCKPLAPFLSSLETLLDKEYNTYNTYPAKEDIFNAFSIDPRNVKVLILGDHPYDGSNEADGMLLSCNGKTPGPLQVVFNELERTYNKLRFETDLTDWKNQGVLLLNSTLTTRRGDKDAHDYLNWKYFTNTIIKYLYSKDTVIICLGEKSKQALIQSINDVNYNDNVIVVGHPRADVKGKKRRFFGSSVFKTCNDLLTLKNQDPIDWVGRKHGQSIYTSILSENDQGS